MRPTFLNFRSPKEQTGEFLKPSVTYTGSQIDDPTQFNKAKTIFSRSQRFQHITEQVKKTSYRVGPGSYSIPISTNKGLAPKLLRESLIKEDSFDYSYVGNVLVKQPNHWKPGASTRPNSTFHGSTQLNDSKMLNRSMDGGEIKSSERARRNFQSAEKQKRPASGNKIDDSNGSLLLKQKNQLQ